MTDFDRAVMLARQAAGLAAGAEMDLPGDLALWRLAGGRPAAAAAILSEDPAGDLQAALEGALTADERRRGAHYTPDAVADRVAALGLDVTSVPALIVDPACGGGAMLLAAARHLAARGADPADVVAEMLWGADVDPLAAAVTEAVLTLWAGGTVPGAGHIVVGDTLLDGATAWSGPPVGGFDAVIGNPPFQSQLARSTARSAAASARLRARFGDVVTPYVDTAALFLLVAVTLARPGGRVALVQPQSTVAARDAGAVRVALASQANLVELWAPEEHLFRANVHVCVPVFEVGPQRANPSPDEVEADLGWTRRLAAARGVPTVDVTGCGRLADRAVVTAGFRHEYYGLVGHVVDAEGPSSAAPLVTCGVIDLGSSAWGARPVRFAKRTWQRPEVDLPAVTAADPRMARWLDRVLRPKVVIASQTSVLEAAADHHGTWVPSTPVVSAVPHVGADVELLTALVCSPPASLWAAQRVPGSGLSAGALRVSAVLVGDLPLPRDQAAWQEAALRLSEGDIDGFAEAATAMFDLSVEDSADVLAWWAERAKRPGLRAEGPGMVTSTSGVAR